jgi:hypothetical protein
MGIMASQLIGAPEGHALSLAHTPATELDAGRDVHGMESFQCPKCDTARVVARITGKCNFSL